MDHIRRWKEKMVHHSKRKSDHHTKGQPDGHTNELSRSRVDQPLDEPVSLIPALRRAEQQPSVGEIARLRKHIKGALLTDRYSDKGFLPINEIGRIATRENVKSILEAQGLEDTEALTTWVMREAQKLFLILVRMTTDRTIPENSPIELLRTLKYHGFRDELLPVQLSGAVGVAAEKKEEEGQEFPFFESWDENDKILFEMHQWMVMAPIFSNRSPFYSNFNTSRRLPWLSKENKAAGAGYFGEVTQVEMHRDHVPDLPQLDPRSYGVAVAVKKAKHGEELADFFDKEVDNLLKIRDYDQPHVVKPIAAYQIKDGRYLMFPWAAGGNLDAYWQKHENVRQDYKKLGWLFDQMSGLFAALKYIHHTQGGRHGDLKPDNILCFIAPDGKETLQIADMGLTSFHNNHDTIQRREELQRTNTPHGHHRYAPPPEPKTFQNQPRSRGYDIWSMGCILIELLIWLTSGYEAVVAYREETPDVWEKQDRHGYRLHPEVVSTMEIMEAGLEANTAYKDLFELARSRMLIVNLPIRVYEAHHAELSPLEERGELSRTLSPSRASASYNTPPPQILLHMATGDVKSGSLGTGLSRASDKLEYVSSKSHCRTMLTQPALNKSLSHHRML
ncbi:cytosolic nonspecific dipeptidase [Apiospora arundinis]